MAAALRPENDWRTAYPFVEAAARKHLDRFKPAQSVTTTNLADLIYSPDEAHDPKVRKRVFQALKALATRGLAAYVTLGEPETIGASQGARRRHWHPAHTAAAPVRHSKCPTCGQEL